MISGLNFIICFGIIVWFVVTYLIYEYVIKIFYFKIVYMYIILVYFLKKLEFWYNLNILILDIFNINLKFIIKRFWFL